MHPTEIRPEQTNIDLAQEWFAKQVRMYGTQDLLYLAGKLNGEAGEVAEKVCKVLRDHCSGSSRSPRDVINVVAIKGEELRQPILVELSDTLWYVLAMAKLLNCSGSELIIIQQNKILGRQSRGTDHGEGDNR